MVIHHRLQQHQQYHQDYANIQIRVQPTSPINNSTTSSTTNCTNLKCNNYKCTPVTSSNGGTCGHHSPLSPMSPSLLRDVPVRLNVSGQLFMCSTQTLTSEEGSYFSCLVNFHHHQQQHHHHNNAQQFLSVPPQQQHTHSHQHTSTHVQEFFIDRDATHFQLILNHLRGYDVASAVEQLRGSEREMLAQDVRFYNIQSMFRFFPLMACSGSHSSDKFGISVSGNGRGNSLSNQVKLFDARTGRGLHSITASHETGAQTSHVIASCCPLNNNNSYNGNKTGSSSSSPSSSLFSSTGGISTATTTTTMNTTTSCLIHLSDHHFVTSYKNEMKLWDGLIGSCQSVWCDQSDDITALFALNSQQFASLSRNHELKVYDITSKRCLYSLNHIVQVIVLNSDTFLCQRLNGSVDVRQKKCGTTTVRDNSHHHNKDQRPLHELIRTITDPLLKGACIISLQEPNSHSSGCDGSDYDNEVVRFVFGNGHCAKVWNALSGALEGVIYDQLSRFDQMVLVKPKVRLVATMYNQSVHLWNMTTMQREYTNRSYSCPGLSKVLPLTDNRFVSIGYSATNALTSLYIWDIAHGKCFLPHFNKNGYVFKGVARLRNGANQADGGFVIVCCREEGENNVARIGVWNPRSEVMYIQEVPFECFDQIAPCQLSVVSL